MVGTWHYDGSVRDDWILHDTVVSWQCFPFVLLDVLNVRSFFSVNRICGHVKTMLSLGLGGFMAMDLMTVSCPTCFHTDSIQSTLHTQLERSCLILSLRDSVCQSQKNQKVCFGSNVESRFQRVYQCATADFSARLYMSDGIFPGKCPCSGPLSAQFCRCILKLGVERITIQTLQASEVVQSESRSSVAGSGALSSSVRVWQQNCSWFLATWIRDSIAGLRCAAGESWTVPSYCVQPTGLVNLHKFP